MKFKKSYFVTSLVLIILIVISFPSATSFQQHVLVKDCNLSLDDVTFSPWNDALQKGVLMGVFNKNQVFGSDPSYKYTIYKTNGEVYYDNYGYGLRGTSKIPIIDITESRNYKIYINCTYLTNESERVEKADFYSSTAYFVTDDFNLTNDLIKKSYRTTGDWDGSPYSYYHPPYESVTVYADYGSRDGPITPGSEFVRSIPTKTYASYFNINRNPSSLVQLDINQRNSEGQEDFVYLRPRFMFYTNNTKISNEQIQYYLCPTVTYVTAKNETDGPTYIGASSRFVVSPGDTITPCLKVENRYLMNTTNVVPYGKTYYMTNQGMGGIGALGTDVRMRDGSMIYEPAFTLTPEESKEYCLGSFGVPTNPSDITKELIIPRIGREYFLKSAMGRLCYSGWPDIGSDGIVYLALTDITTIIKFNITSKIPYFEANADLEASPASGSESGLAVEPGDYSLVVKIYRDKVDYPFDINLATEPIVKLLDSSVLASHLLKGTKQRYTIPIELIGDIAAPESTYIVKFFTNRTKSEPANLQGKLIAATTTDPIFEPGDLLYQYENQIEFKFWENISLRTYCNRFRVFNPSFSEIDVRLKVDSWVDNGNFTAMFREDEDTEYSKYPLFDVRELGPFESRDIDICINATHDIFKWPTDEIFMRPGVTISGTASIVGTYKTTTKNFNMNVTKGDPTNFNLRPLPITKEVNLFNNEYVNKELTLKWEVLGSYKGFEREAGKNYQVKIQIINLTDTAKGVVNETIKPFRVTGFTQYEEQLSISADFYREKYAIKVSIDTENKILEDLGGDAESENDFEEKIKVTACSYDDSEVDRKLFYFDSLRMEKPQLDTTCQCDYCLGDTVCSGGFCRLSGEECHAYDKSRGGDSTKCLEAPGIVCAWNCSGGPCPETGYLGGIPTHPVDAAEGLCLGCTEVPATCFGYNNNDTCIADPCDRENDHCCKTSYCAIASGLFDCNIAESSYGCYWDNAEGQCGFQYMGCKYTIDKTDPKTQECGAGDRFGTYVLLNKDNPSDPDCPRLEIPFRCVPLIVLPFFDIISFVVSMLIIVGVYAVTFRRD